MSETPTIGDVIASRYELLGLLEEAPAYTAYRARDREAEVDVAFWWMNEDLFPTEPKRDGFVGAVVDIRGLIHPNLRRLFEAGRADGGGLFLTSQLASHEGRLLRPGGGRRPPEFEVLRYGTAMTEALEAAHQLGHVHGLLVPSDVVQVAGQIKVGGVGLYRDADLEGVRACFEQSRRYLAPEVLETGLPTPASDVYSLAAILVEMASGVSKPDLAEATEALAEEQIGLADALARALRSAPDRRPPSPRRLLELVRVVLVDDRVPTAEQPAAMPPADAALGAEEDDEGPTVRDMRPVGDSDPTSHYQRLDPEDVAGADARPLAEGAGPPSDRAATAGERRKLFDSHPGEMEEPPGQSSTLQTETVIEREEGQGRMLETIPDQLPPPPEAPPSGESKVAQAPVGPDEPPPRKPSFVSMKPPDEPREPGPKHVPVLDRPEMQPKVRPIGSVTKSVPPGSLGNYAPPRTGPRRKSGSSLARRLWILVGVVALLVAGAVLLTWLLVRSQGGGGGGRGEAEGALGAAAPAGESASAPAGGGGAPVLESDSGPSAPADAAGPCPGDMALVESGEAPFCIDRHEFPGEGRRPQTDVHQIAAAEACEDLGRRLCTEAEWETACRGERGASFPYGEAYRSRACNTEPGPPGTLQPAGAHPECVSAAGAYDMSGNVAEWVAERRRTKGGSALDGSEGRCSARLHRRRRSYEDVGFRCCRDPLAPVGGSR